MRKKTSATNLVRSRTTLSFFAESHTPLPNSIWPRMGLYTLFLKEGAKVCCLKNVKRGRSVRARDK
jgi:hypothetical protein